MRNIGEYKKGAIMHTSVIALCGILYTRMIWSIGYFASRSSVEKTSSPLERIAVEDTCFVEE